MNMKAAMIQARMFPEGLQYGQRPATTAIRRVQQRMTDDGALCHPTHNNSISKQQPGHGKSRAHTKLAPSPCRVLIDAFLLLPCVMKDRPVYSRSNRRLFVTRVLEAKKIANEAGGVGGWGGSVGRWGRG